ncbi:host specificity factor TipJ family phage tail protein [Escherichia coli]|uniref:host specificity factor TipJ family phage tail protein n=1 Tax=Escherichia coli TaxID=562 RepID=UPI000390F10D|nr:host specificity factor TipJ family phage tail protein [Escherichia coli]EQZ00016.1 hypothetical protein G967_02164 [Escherichia coli UMEA 3329-1]
MAGKSLGTLTIDLVAKVGGFVSGLSQSERASQKWRKQVQSDAKAAATAFTAFATAASAAAIGVGVAGYNLLKTTSKQITETDRWAKSLNMSTQSLLAWQYAAEKAGVSGDQMADIFKDIGDKIGDAVLNKSGEAVGALDALGLSAKKLAGESPDKQLLAISDALGKIKTNAEKTTILESLGNDLSKLLPLLDQGGEKLRQYMDAAKQFGVAPDDADIEKLVKVNSLFEDMETQVNGVKIEIATGLANVDLSGLQNAITDMGDVFKDPQVIQGLTDLVGGVVDLANGICGYNKKGKKQNRIVQWEIQYRVYGSGSGWTSKTGSYNQQNINGLGFTERITLASAGLVEVRCRRTNEQGQDNSRDNMYWQSLRGRLLSRPSSYSGVTTMAVSVETGGKLAAQSDRRVNVVATRIYDSGISRSISGALYHIGNELGLAMDNEVIDMLESSYWTPDSEFFDYATTDSVSALEMLQKVTNAGKSYFLLSDGMASVGREGVKTWTGIISPQEMTEALQTAFVAPSADDYDGVDVTYINGTTWAEETVQCRTSDNPTPVKIEDYDLDGVLDQDRAYQIGMRRLMKYRQQRLTHTTTTEMDALCYSVGDRIVFTDDIPGSKTISTLIDDMSTSGGVTTFTVSEPLDWTFNNPRALIRYQDGSASGLLPVTKVSDYELSVSEQDEFIGIILNDQSIEPPRLIFCESSRVGYSALISEISPQSDGTCQVTAKEYRDSFYQYDNATYPGNIS